MTAPTDSTGTTGTTAPEDSPRKEGVDATPLYAALGAGQVVADGARRLAGQVTRTRAELAERTRSWNGGTPVEATDVPRLAVGGALRVAGHVESAYGDLAQRGRSVAGRLRDGNSGAELLRKAMAGLSRPRPGRTTFAAGTGAIVLGETVDPRVDTPVGTPAGTPVDTVTDAPLDPPVADPLTQPAADPIVDPVVDLPADPVVDPVVEPVPTADVTDGTHSGDDAWGDGHRS